LPTFETAVRSNITDENGRNAGLRSTDVENQRIGEINEAAPGTGFSKLRKNLFGMLAAN
jgi:hypothetical protein